jgi:hypothetical protein
VHSLRARRPALSAAARGLCRSRPTIRRLCTHTQRKASAFLRALHNRNILPSKSTRTGLRCSVLITTLSSSAHRAALTCHASITQSTVVKQNPPHPQYSCKTTSRLYRLPASASISSKNTMDGAAALARRNSACTAFSLSPSHLLSSSGPRTVTPQSNQHIIWRQHEENSTVSAIIANSLGDRSTTGTCAASGVYSLAAAQAVLSTAKPQ